MSAVLPAEAEPYGSSPTKTRRTNAEMEAVRAEIYEVLEEQHPASCRGVFYQLVSRGVVAKSEKAYKATCRQLVSMRERGQIPYRWISDGTRWRRKPPSYSSIEDMLEENVRTYRKMMWASQDVYVEIWLEKDALVGTIYGETAAFDVPLMVTRGYASISFLYSAAEAIKAQGKRTIIYHVGDHDPSGLGIERHIEKELRRYAPEVEISLSRLAVTPEQIEELRLPTRPTKGADSRARAFKGESVDVDAIPASLLRQMVRDAIVSHIEPEEWSLNLEIEEAERASCIGFVDAWKQRR